MLAFQEMLVAPAFVGGRQKNAFSFSQVKAVRHLAAASGLLFCKGMLIAMSADKLVLDLTLVLPHVPDERDSCVERLISLLKSDLVADPTPRNQNPPNHLKHHGLVALPAVLPVTGARIRRKYPPLRGVTEPSSRRPRGVLIKTENAYTTRPGRRAMRGDLTITMHFAL